MRIQPETIKQIENAAEIVSKRLYHQRDRAMARDLFDLAMVVGLTQCVLDQPP